MFLCKGLVWLCTQIYFKLSLSLPLYKIVFQTKPQSGFLQNFILGQGFVKNGKFKLFRYKYMLCSFYDLRLTALDFHQKQNNTSGASWQGVCINGAFTVKLLNFQVVMNSITFINLQGSVKQRCLQNSPGYTKSVKNMPFRYKI